MKTGIKSLLAVLLGILLLTGCGSGAGGTGEGEPRPAVFVQGTIYLEKGEAVKTLPDGWEKAGEIRYKLADRQVIDASCESFTANCSGGEVGDEIYADRAAEQLYLKAADGTYVLYVKCYKPMIYAQDTLYVRESGYWTGGSEQLLPEGWQRIGKLQRVVNQDGPVPEENFTGNDSALMEEGDEIYANAEMPGKIYLKYSGNEYIPFVQ